MILRTILRSTFSFVELFQKIEQAVGHGLGLDHVIKGFQLAADDVFLNVAGGMEIDEPAADLGVIAAIASSFRNIQVPPEVAMFGEVGLTGEVRGVLQAQARAREAQTLGFKKLILPESNKKGLEKLLGIRVIGVRNLEEAMEPIF